MHDLLLKGGRLLDPSTGLDGLQDIAVTASTFDRNAVKAMVAGRRAPS